MGGGCEDLPSNFLASRHSILLPSNFLAADPPSIYLEGSAFSNSRNDDFAEHIYHVTSDQSAEPPGSKFLFVFLCIFHKLRLCAGTGADRENIRFSNVFVVVLTLGLR